VRRILSVHRERDLATGPSCSRVRRWLFLHLVLAAPLLSQPQQMLLFGEGFNGVPFPPAGWTVVNRDSGLLAPWFPGSTSSAFPPFEGTGFAADNFQRANGTYLDDYLITPGIPGIGSTGVVDSLIFMARSVLYAPPLVNIPDSLMILVSVSGADPGDFTFMVDYLEVAKESWKRYAYSLTDIVPFNSTVLIAFRYLHFNGGETGAGSDFLGIDDVRIERSVSTGTGGIAPPPAQFALHQNYPNPFNATTKIEFSIGNSEYTILKVYDALGREVATLVDGVLDAGIHSAVWDARGSASGIYYYRVSAGPFTLTGHMIQLK
jgi:hypothetical protein